MPLVCMQCAIKALALGEPLPPPTDETPEAHLARVHPNPDDTARERAIFERLAADRLTKGQ